MSQENERKRIGARSTALTWVAALSAAFLAGAAFATVLIFSFAEFSPADAPSSEAGLRGESAESANEKPFYTVGKRTRGPLTMEELQINIPEHLAAMMTARKQACFLEKIGELAEEAGDPETLNPVDVAFLPTDGSWDELTFFGRRSLLAQAIVSRAITLC
jgi:hypothetical protein